ncbi:MAG: DUF2786 domain-containing protein [Acidimicrobiales bacterium]
MSKNGLFDEMRADMAEKVRKLLAQAEDPGATPEEAATFTAKAQQLMTKYSIDLAMVVDADRADQVVVKVWKVNGPYSAHKLDMVFSAARSNDCRAIYARLGGGAHQVSVVGFPHDVDWVQTLAASLDLQLSIALAQASRAKPEHVHGRTFSVGFVKGFTDEVGERLLRARRQAVADAVSAFAAERAGAGGSGAGGSEAGGSGAGGSGAAGRDRPGTPVEGPSVALVLAAKDKRVDDEFKVHFPHVRTMHRYVRLQSWSGYQPGRDAGSRAQLAKAPLSGRRSLSA